MSKILFMPSNTDIKNYEPYVDGFIFGIKNWCVNMPLEITLEVLTKIKTDKEIFIALNKNIYSSELEELKKILIQIDKLNIKGILYADTCFINLKKELNLKTNLVWSQEHLTTNYQTINYWYQYGAKYAYLSGEITLEEIKEIKLKTTSKLIVPIFGFLPMFTSKRHEVKNYLNHFNLLDNSQIYYMGKEENVYPLVDNQEGTVAYSSHILNGFEEYLKLDIDYVTINSFLIEDKTIIKVLKSFKEKKWNPSIILSNIDKGFLYKETIYKVKKDR